MTVKCVQLTNEREPRKKHVIDNEQHIKNKVASYRRQDVKMNRPVDENVTPFDVARKLRECDMCCFYCGAKMSTNQQTQWTLDRKENHIAHTDANTVVACLRCNLKKRRQDTQRFIDGGRLATSKVKKLENQ